ncbi:MAG: RNA-binding transcriptional accessory protein [Planctomycetes bacterium]|nr:RNA-binding transcriptional accessory protein [Planctomycetota bacterium]
MTSIATRIATELGARTDQVAAAVRLLDEGATVPFVARYRKEATGGLDDTQLRALAERLVYLRELEQRRDVVLRSIEEQGRMTPELRARVLAADTKVGLEDLYLPFRPRRRTKAQIAREAGLEPLADALLADPTLDPAAAAARHLRPDLGFASAEAALDGARQILMERFAEHAALVGRLREMVWGGAEVHARVVAGKEAEGARFADYFTHREALARMPSHRALALFRGRALGVLDVGLDLEPEPAGREGPRTSRCEGEIARTFAIADRGRPADRWLVDTVRQAWRVKLSAHLEVELFERLRERAETEALAVFGANLRDLLLAAPAGPRVVMGLDPGLRTGVKVAVVDRTGKLVATATVHPHEPRKDWEGALRALAALVAAHDVEIVSIGNGTASRETDRLAAELQRRLPGRRLQKVVVSEAGASVYSASELAAREFPELDVALRGAVSIARRLQDPLAELVKIEPKAIGVGQYQHDVSQSRLARTLDAVVEDCVNAVGVDVNTASVPLLRRISGLNEALAKQIVGHRDQHGPFQDRRQLLDVPRLGPKTFEQAAGFLRIRGGRQPLDESSVHPEAYPVVERILARTGRALREVIGDRTVLRALRPQEFTDAHFGVPTVTDILAELEKPGRDPRPEFRTATFREGVESLADLQPDMILEGVVTNVTAFGAFVDVGVHQDGLVHISALSERYVADPREVVKAGDVVRVKVLSVDLARQRIALTLRLQDPARDHAGRGERGRGVPPAPAAPRARPEPEPQSPLAAQLAKLKGRPGSG